MLYYSSGIINQMVVVPHYYNTDGRVGVQGIQPWCTYIIIGIFTTVLYIYIYIYEFLWQ